jgi:hypothetical protein
MSEGRVGNVHWLADIRSNTAAADFCHPRPTAAAELAADQGFRARVHRLYANGRRPISELFAEIGAEHLIRADIEQRIDRYLALSDQTLDLLDVRRIPAAPLHMVRP